MTYPPGPAAYPAPPVGRRRRRSSGLMRVVKWALAIVVFLFAAATMLGLVEAQTGLTATVLGLALSILVVGIVVPVFVWLDRFEREPVGLLLFAFCWGAFFATLGAAVLNDIGAYLVGATGEDNTTVAVFVAPPIEETLKALGPLLIVLFRRREVDGIVDGIVYAGLSAAGFAMIEDVLYLANGYADAGRHGLLGTFVVRVLMSPFAHPMFTICTGVGLGIAALSRSWVVRLGAPLAGWCCAVMLHMLWNSTAMLAQDGWLEVYVGVQVPLFAGFATLLVLVSRAEASKITASLMPYVDAGLLSAQEVTMLGSMRERRYARAWAAAHGGPPLAKQMREFQHSATDLAMTRSRLQHGQVDAKVVAMEQADLHEVMMLRRPFLNTALYRFYGWQQQAQHRR